MCGWLQADDKGMDHVPKEFSPLATGIVLHVGDTSPNIIHLTESRIGALDTEIGKQFRKWARRKYGLITSKKWYIKSAKRD